jgi:hypothetical protein
MEHWWNDDYIRGKSKEFGTKPVSVLLFPP